MECSGHLMYVRYDVPTYTYVYVRTCLPMYVTIFTAPRSNMDTTDERTSLRSNGIAGDRSSGVREERRGPGDVELPVQN
jgi:hypothetical protein